MSGAHIARKFKGAGQTFCFF